MNDWELYQQSKVQNETDPNSAMAVQKEAPQSDWEMYKASKQAASVALNNAKNSGLNGQEPSVFDRIFTQPLERAQERMAGVFERTMAPTPSLQEQMSDPAKLQEAYRNNTSLPSVLLQVGGAPISLGFDVAGNAIMVGAEQPLKLVPESTKENVVQFFSEMSQTPLGQKAIQAASNGVESWNTFKEEYPNEAANFEVGLDIFGGVPRNLIKNKSLTVKPIAIERVGMRNVTKPLAGDDADLYNVAFVGKKKTIDQAKNTTDPQGVFRSQEQLATPDQLETIDLLKAAGAKGSNTLQQNFNVVTKELDALDDKVIALSRKQKNPVDVSLFKQNLNAEVQLLQDQFPDLFAGSQAKKAFEAAYSRMMAKMQEQGPSVEGLVQARRAFDREMERQGIDLGSDSIGLGLVASRAVRNAANKTLYASVPEAEKIFGKMSKLLSVYDNIGMKAAEESSTAVGRFVADLGLSHLLGDSLASRTLNAGYLLGFSPVLVPYQLIKAGLKLPSPARGRAKVAYVVRDIKDEFAKALKATQDPVKKRALLLQQPVVYSALDSAARQMMQEENY